MMSLVYIYRLTVVFFRINMFFLAVRYDTCIANSCNSRGLPWRHLGKLPSHASGCWILAWMRLLSIGIQLLGIAIGIQRNGPKALVVYRPRPSLNFEASEHQWCTMLFPYSPHLSRLCSSFSANAAWLPDVLEGAPFCSLAPQYPGLAWSK